MRMYMQPMYMQVTDLSRSSKQVWRRAITCSSSKRHRKGLIIVKHVTHMQVCQREDCTNEECNLEQFITNVWDAFDIKESLFTIRDGIEVRLKKISFMNLALEEIYNEGDCISIQEIQAYIHSANIFAYKRIDTYSLELSSNRLAWKFI